jgi:type II secretory pathway component GspD/PulD (secretin)
MTKMNFKLYTFFLLFLLVTSCAPRQAVKQEEQPPAPQPVEVAQLPDVEQKKEVREEKAPAPAAEKKPEEQYVMLNFENADIGTVISTVSEMLKMNYILAPGVTGKITIQSHNKVPLSELFSTFQTLLEFNGFTAIKDGSFYRIVPIDTAKQQPVKVDAGKKPEIPKDASFITQQIPMEYVKAGDVANIVRNLMPRGTDIIVYEPSNMLIVTAPPSGIIKTMKLIEAIDIPATERDSIRTFVYSVENGEAKKLADVLKSLYGKQKSGEQPVRAVTPAAQAALRRPVAAAGAPQPAAPAAQSGATLLEGVAGVIEGEVVFDAYEDINALIIKATPRAYLTLLETIKKLDTQPKQVLIEVLIAEVTLDDRTDLGLEWILKGNGRVFNEDFDYIVGNTQNPGNFFGGDSTTTPPTPPTIGGVLTPVVSGGLFANILSKNQFDVLIKAAATSGKVNVLASPHILALDNKEAKIEIADEVPVATTISQPQTTTELTTSQVQFKSAGVILTVTPHINEKKQVTLKINQEVSQLGQVFPIGGEDYQGFTTRKATTTSIVQDGHTLVIGGIISEQLNKSRNGIPFLSKIPILGYLFGTTTDIVKRTELILMVTPHVVGNQEEADMVTEEYKNKVEGIKGKIQQGVRKQAGEMVTSDQADVHFHDTGGETK